ncbi:fatty acyl-CoA reductase wat-like isoform X2 [Anticarsia gemmatalis]|uniref:fatty acyl-CoA reductase wat-like isoform X2 n=1 Tax=Anticarsia gemmatalis TaxID=129554 RepID=UPI003F767414
MDAGLAVEQVALALQEPMNAVIERGDSSVQQFYRDATVFLTGGSGFIGKQLIAKLFGTCKLKKIYLLSRRKKEKTFRERVTEMLTDPIFEGLLKEQPSFVDRLVPIEGDMIDIGLGISDEDRKTIIKEVDIIIHGAATITFDAPLRSTILTNVRGTREIISLAKQCKKLRSFLYISTAFSHATISSEGQEILEQFYPCPVDPDLMVKFVESVDEDRLNSLQRGLILNWPNTYSFSKAIAEEMVRLKAGDLPICILRPTIVICSKRDVNPGWIDISSVYGPSGITLGTMMGVIHSLQTRQELRIDFVPVDYVVNAGLVAATTAREQPLKIYHIGTNCRNPLFWD